MGVVWSSVQAGKRSSIVSLVSRKSWIEIFSFGVVRSRVCAYQTSYSSFWVGKRLVVSRNFFETKSTHCHLVPWHFPKIIFIFLYFLVVYDFLFFILNRRNCKLCFCSSILFVFWTEPWGTPVHRRASGLCSWTTAFCSFHIANRKCNKSWSVKPK